MGCISCVDGVRDDMEFRYIKYNKEAKPGDTYTVELDVVSLAAWFGDSALVTANDLDDNTCIYSSGNFGLARGTTVHITFTGIMPDRDLRVRLALFDINFLARDDCEDTHDFVIIKGIKTLPAKVIGDKQPLWVYLVIGLVVLVIIYIVYEYTRKK